MLVSNRLKLLIIICVGMLGCVNKQPPVTKYPMIFSPIDPRIIFVDVDVLQGNNLPLLNIPPVADKNGFLMVQIAGNSYTGIHQKFQYCMQWFDNKGLIVTSLTRPLTCWVDFYIFRNKPFHIKVIAPSKNIISFQMLIKESKS